MRSLSRRSFLTGAAMAAASTVCASAVAAERTPRIGVQLFSAREALAKDFAGTLKRIAALGYREVEAAGFYNHSAGDVKRMMAEAGQNPAEMMRAHAGRFSMLHLKDLKPAPAGTDPSERVSTEIGYGVVDFGPIFAAAKATGIRHYFVEQEDFDKPVFEALAIDYKNSNTLARGGHLRRM